MEELARELFPGVRLTTIRTERFHSGYFGVHLLRPLRREDASQSALLMNVLHRGTRTLPDMVRISEALETLYGSALEPGLRQLGEVTAIGLTAVFPDDRYLPDGENCMEKIVAIAGEMLLDPATRGGLLRDDYVRSERQNLHDRVAAGINNKRSYALKRARQKMFAEEPYGVYPLGEAEDALHFDDKTTNPVQYEKELNKTVPLICCDQFSVNAIDFDKTLEKVYAKIDSFVIYICLEGQTHVVYEEDVQTLKKGEVMLVPAIATELAMVPEVRTKLLEVYIS